MTDTTSFGSLSGILAWTGRNKLQYVGNDEKLPYVLKDKLYHYFAFDGQKFNLVMTSEKELK
jgi:hypothetical protein